MAASRKRPRRRPVPESLSRVYCSACGGFFQQELAGCTYGCKWDCVDAAARPLGNLRVRFYAMTCDAPLYSLASVTDSRAPR